MHAPYARSTRRQIVIVLAIAIGAATAAPAAAQSARTAVAIPAALAASLPMPEPTQDAPRCAAAFSGAIAIRAGSDARTAIAQAYSVDDAADVDDDVIDPDALSPGSGMVLVDSLGKIIASEKPQVALAEITPTDCCPTAATWAAALVVRGATSSYTVSNGSATRALCVDAMNPPPSSRSPL